MTMRWTAAGFHPAVAESGGPSGPRKRPEAHGIFLGALLVLMLVLVGRADAQSTQSPDAVLQQLLQGRSQAAPGANGPEYTPSPLDTSAGPSTTGGAAPLAPPAGRPVFAVPEQPLSPLETDYQARLKSALPEGSQAAAQVSGSELRQFGYDQLRNRLTTSQVPAGSVGSGYVLGSGDELVVTFRGGRTDSIRTRVDRDGRVVLPGLAPVEAAGRAFGEVQDQLLALIRGAYSQTDAYISLGTVRSVSVYVLGQVQNPGPQQLNGLSTLVDAIVAAGGITKTGSLRQVVVTRGGGSASVDLYSLLEGGNSGDLGLADGERITVLPLGPTIAVAGKVGRPGIYELPKPGGQISAAAALALGGGTLRSEGSTLVRLSTDRTGRDVVVPVPDAAATTLRGGDILLVLQTGNAEIAGFTLDGDVPSPGIRSLQSEPTLRSVATDPAQLGADAYLPFAVLETSDPVTRARHFVGVDLTAVAAGGPDVRFQPNDRLIVLGISDITFLGSADVQSVISGNTALWTAARTAAIAAAPTSGQSNIASPSFTGAVPAGVNGYPAPGGGNAGGVSASTSPLAGQGGVPGVPPDVFPTLSPNAPACAGLRELQSIRSTTRGSRFAGAVLYNANTPNVPGLINHQPCPAIFDRIPTLLPFLLDYGTTMEGEVNNPGIYPVMPGTPLSKIVAEAGGLAPGADVGGVELSRFVGATANTTTTIDAHRTPLDSVALTPGDVVRFSQIFSDRESESVQIDGEVRQPGTYVVARGETLSQLLARAGGLTPYAYPLGTVFTRVSVQRQEQAANVRAADQFEESLSLAASQVSAINQQAPANAAELATLQLLVQDLRNAPALGRVVVEADPAVLAARPQEDMLLEGGDLIVIPKRPSTISVSGEVLNPGAEQFVESYRASDYIRAAGGLTEAADDSRAFLILPNGSAEPLSLSSWNYSTVHIPPGSTIVVPRNPAPYQWWTLATSLIQTTSQIALSAAALAVIAHQ